MNFNSLTVQALIIVEAETMRQFEALILSPFCVEVPNTSTYAERIERELRIGPSIYALNAAERRMQRAG